MSNKDWKPEEGSSIDYLRSTYPGMAKKCDYKRSRSAAIRLACLECCCGQTSMVERCTVVKCPLWQFRRGNSTFPDEERSQRNALIPSEEWYDQKLATYGTSNEE